MPQLNKGGKFVFGKSLIREDGSLQIPPQAAEEYAICSEGRVYLHTGAKATGGFCVTRRGLLLPSKLGPYPGRKPGSARLRPFGGVLYSLQRPEVLLAGGLPGRLAPPDPGDAPGFGLGPRPEADGGPQQYSKCV